MCVCSGAAPSGLAAVRRPARQDAAAPAGAPGPRAASHQRLRHRHKGGARQQRASTAGVTHDVTHDES